MSVLVKGGTVINAEAEARADVRCRGGSIVEIAPSLEIEAGERLLDATGCYVIPGGVDPHVHMQLPVAGTVSSDDFESGTLAAVAGGTTTILDFVHPQRGESFLEALAARRREAAAAVCDVGLHMAVTWWGESADTWMAECVAAGVPSFKLYMAYKETVGLDDADIVSAMQAASDLGAVVLVHAEHGEAIEHLRNRAAAAGRLGPAEHAATRPPILEGEATHRAATLAGMLDTQLYVVHVTCREAVGAIAAARSRGWPVRAETCPHYLLLDEAAYQIPNFEASAFVVAPPLRPREHQEALWEALADGTLQAVGTDHCPFTMEQKRLGRSDFRRIPGGAAGVEHRLQLLWTYGVTAGRIDRCRFVELVSTSPARIFGLESRKGAIVPGADADIVVWDPAASATISAATHHHRCDRSIFEGFEVNGAPKTVIVGGRVAWHDGSHRIERGAGRFLRRSLPRQPRTASTDATPTGDVRSKDPGTGAGSP
jgi:dihydropyrimidinase